VSPDRIARAKAGFLKNPRSEEGRMETPTANLSFEKHIKPLFREEDQKAMDFSFDLWDYDDVKDNSTAILEELVGGGMPCDGAWPEDKVALFRSWVDTGMPE
jgi:hypothetical protein